MSPTQRYFSRNARNTGRTDRTLKCILGPQIIRMNFAGVGRTGLQHWTVGRQRADWPPARTAWAWSGRNGPGEEDCPGLPRREPIAVTPESPLQFAKVCSGSVLRRSIERGQVIRSEGMKATPSATLPMRRRSRPRRPWEPRTMRSAGHASARSKITARGSPTGTDSWS